MSPTFETPNAALPPLIGGGGNAAMRGRSPTHMVPRSASMVVPKGHGKGVGMMPAGVHPSCYASVAPRHPGQLIAVPVSPVSSIAIHGQRPGVPAGVIQQQVPRQQPQPQPRVEIQEVVRQVPKIQVVTQERIVDVPQIQYVEKIVEVPQTVVQVVDRFVDRFVEKTVVQVVDRHVPRIQIREVVREVPVVRVQKQERIVEAAMMGQQQYETALVPAIGAMDYQQYADPSVAADFAMMVQPSQYDYSQARFIDASWNEPMAMRSSDGTLRSSSFAPEAYQNDTIESQLMDNQGYIQQGTYEIDGQGYYVDEEGAIFQVDLVDNQADSYQQQQYEDQQYNDLQQIQDQQAQYTNGGYVNDGGYITEEGLEYMDGQQQVDDQYARYEQYDQPPNIQQYEPYEVGADVAAGIARQPQEEKQDESPAEDQFTRLLNSLEARVDLMAQMQHTRAEIQKHTRNLQNNKAGTNSMGNDRILELPSTDQSQVPMIELEPDRPFSNFVQYQSSGNNYQEEVLEQQLVPISGAGAELVRANALLRNEFQDQQGVVTDLQREVAGMRTQLLSLSVEPESGMAESTILLAVGTRVEARWMKDDGSDAAFGTQWLPGYISRANQDGTFQIEYDNGAACSRVPRQYLRGICEAQFEDPSDPEVSDLQMALAQERQRHESSTQQWSRERQRLLDELTTLKTQSLVGPGGRRALGNLPTVGEDANSGFSSMLHTNPVLPANGLQLARNSRLMAPLCRNPCGMNIELSEDGYTAKRIRGCRQSVVIGSTPLERQELGHYFEVVVQETVNGWVGGLGIGVTRVSPAELKRMPDKAWRIPSTFIVGYWGCLFLDGREKRTRWKADTLTVGSRVGLLVTGDGRGDLIVFVDGEPVVRADDVLPTSGLRSEELYPVIDVFAATLSVELQQSAVAPAKPWSSNPSPPGSPGSAATRSIGSTTLSVGTRPTNISGLPSVG